MNILLLRRSAYTFLFGLFTILLVSCAITGNGYGYYDGANIGIGPGYYEPYGSYYGGWGPGYRVGPIHGNNYHPALGGHPTPHAYKAAPKSRPVPSIPSRRRTRDVEKQSRPRN